MGTWIKPQYHNGAADPDKAYAQLKAQGYTDDQLNPPPAAARIELHAQWKRVVDEHKHYYAIYECSNCRFVFMAATPYCPQCGATMEGVEAET